MKLQKLSDFYPSEFVIVMSEDFTLEEQLIQKLATLIIDFMIDFFEKSKLQDIDSVYFYNFIDKPPTSGFYTRIGWYFLFNIKTNTFYIGSSTQIGKRKTNHENDFKNYFNKKDTMLLSTLAKSIQEDTVISDFLFIPFTITCSTLPTKFGEVHEKIDLKFLGFVEMNLIKYFKNHPVYKKLILNEKLTNQFDFGNNFGKTSGGGSAKQPICEVNGKYVWTSINDCAAFFRVTKDVIRNRIKRNYFKRITPSELNAWDRNFIISKENFDNFTDETRKNLILKYIKL